MWKGAVCAVMACALAPGCVTWVGHELPPVRYEDLTPEDPKPAADYEIFLDNGEGSVAKLPPDSYGVREVLERSRCFSRIHPGADTEPYHLKFVVSNATGPTRRAWQSVNSVLFIITFTFFPAIASSTNVVVVDVQSGNQSLRRYRYQEGEGGICWTPVGLLALGVHALFTLDDPTPSIERILLNFLHDVQRDGLMKGPATTG